MDSEEKKQKSKLATAWDYALRVLGTIRILFWLFNRND
ncbi:hypothetical protein JOC94_004216 [Bacillus thermophilus]|uniref:Uncharacterized protein n=1 Tax=Siminovitchia thermophila TaxID=1245522 RepID=A0ABS2RC05_9BACI|nr:hypothetical protein [Siminovitchia thermophila]